MELLKSYAHQVASYHPAKDRDELFAEVYDELCEEFADWSASHPGGDEVAFLNANRQHPMRHATHLAGEHQNYLIGPQFYYSFIEALKAAAGITAAMNPPVRAPAHATLCPGRARQRAHATKTGTVSFMFSCDSAVNPSRKPPARR